MGTLTQSHWMLNNRVPLMSKAAWNEPNNNGRSPKDSPPIEKKRARRQTNWLYQQRAPLSSVDDTNVNDASRVTSPLLKEELRVRSKSLPRPIIKSNGVAVRAASRGASGRKVHFRPQVTVEYMDDEKHLRTEESDLICEPRDRQTFMSRNMARIHLRHQQQQQQMQQLQFHEHTSPLSSPPHLPATLEANVALSEFHANQNKQEEQRPHVDIFFIPDKQQEGVTRMRMVVNIGAQFHPDDICVKANMSGNKVRVTASKIVDINSGAVEPINERFTLPMDVDPYAVEARLDTRGHLTIEAPLLTPERRAALQKQHSQSATSQQQQTVTSSSL